MIQTSRDDYSNLKNDVREIWVPAVGVQTVTDLLRKNIDNLLKMNNIPCECTSMYGLKESLKQLCEECFPSYIFKTSFDAYFDTEPPFQLGEAMLSGSFSEGLFLYSTEPPDMDFMCVLKNITFSQDNQEDGGLLLKEDTPFVYAFVTKEETQHLWSEFFDKKDKQVGTYRLSSRKLKEKLEENYKKSGGLFQTSGKEELEEVAEGAAVTIRKPKPVVLPFDILGGSGKGILNTWPFRRNKCGACSNEAFFSR